MAAKKKKENKGPMSLQEKIDLLKTKHGPDHFTDNSGFPAVERASSGLLSVDKAMGGGLPYGKVLEMFGPESGGKTSMAMHLAAQVQKDGKSVCYIDAEIAFDYDFAKIVGLDTSPDKFVLVQPRFGEEGLDIAKEMIDVENMGLIIIDSVPSMLPKAQVDGDIGDQHIGLQARMMSKFFPMVLSKLESNKCSMLFINQLREKIGVMFGSPETTPGGRALKFYSSIRMRVRKIKYIEEEGEPIGMLCGMHVQKNKTAIPFKRAEYELYFDSGFSKESDMFDAAVESGLIVKKGAWVYYQKEEGKEPIQISQGKSAALDLLRDNPELLKEIWNKLIKAVDTKTE